MKITRINYFGVMAVLIFGVLSLFPVKKIFAETDEPLWSVFVYGGKWSDNPIAHIIRFETEFENSYVWAAGISRNIYDITDFLVIEAELGTARHTGLQDHCEFNAALNLRLHRFPWDDYIKTSLAYGLGPSYATSRPPIENTTDRGPAHILVFMPVEVAFGPPGKSNSPLEFIIRVHHRSGAYGIVSTAKGSNFVTAGFRYRF